MLSNQLNELNELTWLLSGAHPTSLDRPGTAALGAASATATGAATTVAGAASAVPAPAAVGELSPGFTSWRQG